MSQDMVVARMERVEERVVDTLSYIHDTHCAFDRGPGMSVQRLLFSVKEIANAIGVSKTTAWKVVDEMEYRGLLRKERYMLTKFATDHRWRFMYSVTEKGAQVISEMWGLETNS